MLFKNFLWKEVYFSDCEIHSHKSERIEGVLFWDGARDKKINRVLQGRVGKGEYCQGIQN
jgi:hypothetical protein